MKIFALLLIGCASSVAPDPALEGLAVTRVAPSTIVPGTKLTIQGASFVDAPWGVTTLHLDGSADVRWPAAFVDFNTLTVAIDAEKIAEVGGDFTGAATVEVVSASDEQTYTSPALDVNLQFRTQLAPAPSMIQASGVVFVNDAIEVDGDGFLLGGGEGDSIAHVEGCFRPDGGGACTPVAARDLALLPADPLDRTRATFAFGPQVAGIRPGAFTGTVTIENHQPGQAPAAAAASDVMYDLVTSQIFSVDPPAASLGQYVFVHGGGFAGGDAGALTELELAGSFAKAGAGAVPVTLTLIPEFVEGRLVRYVLNTDDALGHALDLRTETGTFTGTITPIVSWQADRVRGVPTSASFRIAPVKQVVYLHFETSYVEGLRDFGLRAVDAQIRARIVAACQDAYRGVNIEFRTEPPADFALFENVDLVGIDPNDMGLFGYDNSPGKDSGNVRLYDRLGGVNALTQQDGYPGFGGVFLRSLMAFSKHPGDFTRAADGAADPAFDEIFDEFRADQGGDPIVAADLAGGVVALADGGACPGGSRAEKIACAVFVMGNLVGGTLSHEIGHSLGLANPYADGFHDNGDLPNRLMDAGGDRPFPERAQLQGQGPAVFCDAEYTYLRMILPSDEAPPPVTRPGCN